MFSNIRAEMTRNGKTVKDIAEIFHVSMNSVSNKLNGKTKFTADEIKLLADKFHCSMDYLFGRKGFKK